MSELKSNIRKLADELKADYEFDSKSGKVKFADVEKKVVGNLPEDLTLNQIKEVQGFLIDTTAAQSLALGEIGLVELKKKGTPNRITASSNFGYSKMESTFHKEMSGNAAGKDWKKFGKTTANLVVGTGRRNAPFKDVQAHLAEKAESVFSN